MTIGTISEETRRQARPLADIPTDYESDIPFDLIIIDNYRKNKSDRYLMELADSISNNGMFQEPGLIKDLNGKYHLAFGQCRVLACRDHLNEVSLRRAKVWPAEAMPYIKTIALIENMERQDTSLADEIAGLQDVLESEYGAFETPVIAFCEQTGRNVAEIRNKLKIYEASNSNDAIKRILDEEIVKDYKSIYNLTRCIESAAGARKKKVDDFIGRVLSDKVVGNMRKATEQLMKYSQGKITATALPPSVKGETEKPVTAPVSESAPTKRKPLLAAKSLNGVIDKINNSVDEDLTEDVIESLKQLRDAINSKVAV